MHTTRVLMSTMAALTTLGLAACTSAAAVSASTSVVASKAPALPALAVGRSGPGRYTTGPCHDRKGVAGTPFTSQPLPDPACTPGTVNPAVTQADIASTICSSGWTSTIRGSSLDRVDMA